MNLSTAETTNKEHLSVLNRDCRSCPILRVTASPSLDLDELCLLDKGYKNELGLHLDTLSNRFKVICKLGNGQFGQVSKAEYIKSSLPSPSWKKGSLLDDTKIPSRVSKNSTMAVKSIQLSKTSTYKHLIKEINFIKNVPRHQNLLDVYDLFFDPHLERLYIATEYMQRNLYEVMKYSRHKNKGFSDYTVKSILSQIVAGMKHIHDSGYIHFDLKPENILLRGTVPKFDLFRDKIIHEDEECRKIDLYTVKIADYGLCTEAAKFPRNVSKGPYIGSRWYRPPEGMLLLCPYGKPFDIWALGCIAFEVVAFSPLFPGKDFADQLLKMLSLLGTPSSGFARSFGPDYVPIYGLWTKGNGRLKMALRDTSFRLDVRCTDISTVLKGGATEDLCHLIRSCLCWDPELRATIGQISEMNYFEGTCVDESPELLGKEAKLGTLPLAEDSCASKHS